MGNKPWWDAECDKAVTTRKRAYRSLLDAPSRESLANYRRISQETRKIIAKRRENFRSFINEIDNNFSISRFWDNIGKLKNCSFNNASTLSPPSISRNEITSK